MAVTEYLRYTVDLNKDTELKSIANWVAGDNVAHTIEMTVMSDGSPADLTGVVCVGAVILPDESHIDLRGTISGNKCTIPIPEQAYAMFGRIAVVVRLSTETELRTVLHLTTLVMKADGNGKISTTTLDTLSGELAKAQRVLDSIPESYDELQDDVADFKRDLVLVQGTQPTSEDNRIWLNPNKRREYTVPTYEEFSKLQGDISQLPAELGFEKTGQEFNYKTAVNNLAITKATGKTSYNESYWMSDKIYVGGNTSIITSWLVYRVAFYAQNDAYLSANTIDGLAANVVTTIPDSTKYILLQFKKATLPFDRANTFILSFGDTVADRSDFYKLPKIEGAIYDIQQQIHVPIGYRYYGEKINLDTKLDYEPLGNFWSQQAGCVCGKYLFRFDTNNYFRVFDLETKTQVGKYILNGGLSPHCNSACFGVEIFNGDMFPLLYVNAYSTTGTPHGTCYVYRITNDFTSILAQTISVGFTDDPIWTNGAGDTRPYGNFCVDIQRKCLYVYTLLDTDRKTRFFRFNLPTLSKGENVTLKKSDIIEMFDCDYFPYIQDNCIRNGKMYICSGMGDDSSNGWIRVVDLIRKAEVSRINLNEIGINVEPQCIDVYDGHLICGTSDIYSFTF